MNEHAPTLARLPLHPARAALAATLAACVVACASPAEPTTGTPLVAPETTATRLAAAPPPAAPSSTLDPRLQAIAEAELQRAVDDWRPSAAAVLVLDPARGEILADAGRDHGVPADVAARNTYVTGSTLKAVTLAGALEDGVVSSGDTFDCEQGSWSYQGHPVHDASHNGTLPLTEMLAVSTNVGFTKVFDRMGGARLSRWLRAFHFGVAPQVDGATAGWLPEVVEERSYTSGVLAIGERMTASPLQLATAYATLANGGVYVAPTLSRRSGAVPGERVLRAETALAVVRMLEGAVNSDKSTAALARIQGVRVAGKTGTASWDLPGGAEGLYASFVGIVPAEAPRYVILVGLEQPRDDAGGGKSAAPVFARVASRVLALP